MFHKASEMRGTTVVATDGEVGKIDDVYFDDENWGVRYLVVKSGGWFHERKVLISPHAVAQAAPGDGLLHVDLSREQVRGAPPIDTDQPVSRREEIAHARYYRYPYYWSGPHLWGVSVAPGMQSIAADAGAAPGGAPLDAGTAEHAKAEQDAIDRCHLRSGREVVGYAAAARDGEVGRIDDLLIDMDSWAVRQVVVDTRKWLPGGQVAVPVSTVSHIDWATSTLTLATDRQTVQQG